MAALIGKAKAVSEEYNSALADLTFNSKPMINVLTMLAEENNDHGQVIVQVICDRIKKVGVDQKMPSLYLLDSILKNIGGDYVPIISKFIVEVFCHTFEVANDERKRMSLFKLRNTWTQYIPAKNLYELDVRINRTDPNWPVIAPTNTVKPSQMPPGPSPKVHINPKFLTTDGTTAVTTTIAVAAGNVENVDDVASLKKKRLLEEEKMVQEKLKLLQAEKLKREREQHEAELKRQQMEREKLLADQKRQLELLRKQQQSLTDKNKNVATNNESEENSSRDPRKRNISGSKDPRLGKAHTKPTLGKSAVSVVNKIMTNMNVKKTKPSFVTNKNPSGRHPQSFADVHQQRLNKPPVILNQTDTVNPHKKEPNNSQSSVNSQLDGIMSNMEKTFSPESTLESKLPNLQSKIPIQTHLVAELTKPIEEKVEKSNDMSSVSVLEVKPFVNAANQHLPNHQANPDPSSEEEEPPPPGTEVIPPQSMVLQGAPVPTVTTMPVRPTVPKMTALVPTIEEVKLAQAVALARTGPPPVPPMQINPAVQQLNSLNSVDMQIAAQAAAIATAIHQLQSVNQTVNQLNQLQTTIYQQSPNQASMNPHQSAELAAKLIQLVNSQPNLIGQAVQQMPSNTVRDIKGGTATPPQRQEKALSDGRDGRRKEQRENRKEPLGRDAREIAKERRELRERDALSKNGKDVEGRSRDDRKRDAKERNGRERDFRDRDAGRERDRKREDKPERTRDRSPYRGRNERDSRQRSRSPAHRDRKDGRMTPERSVKGKLERGRPDPKDQPPNKKAKEIEDSQERSRKARARSPSRYWFRMERKIETEKRVEEKEKELHLQRIRKDSEGELSETPMKTDSRQKPSMGKPDDISTEEWTSYKKDRRKEFRYIKSRLLDIRRDIRDGIPDVNIGVLKDYRIEVNQKMKKGDLSKEHYDELCQLMDHIYEAHTFKINNPHEMPPFRGQNQPGGPFGPRGFMPRHPGGFNGIGRVPLYGPNERFPPPQNMNEMHPDRHPRPPFIHPPRQPGVPVREPFPHPPRDRLPTSGPDPRFESRPPFQPFRGSQPNTRPPPGHPMERPPPGHPLDRLPLGHPLERPPLGHPMERPPRPPPGHPMERPPLGHSMERPPPGHHMERPPLGHPMERLPLGHPMERPPRPMPGHPLERPPLGPPMERPPPGHPMERPPMDPMRPPFPMDVRETFQDNRFPPPRPFDQRHQGPNQFPSPAMGPRPGVGPIPGIRPAPEMGHPPPEMSLPRTMGPHPVFPSGGDIRQPFGPADQLLPFHNMPPGFQRFPLPEQFHQPQGSESSSPMDIGALLGKLMAHGITVEPKKIILEVPDITLNMEDLRKRHEGVINQLLQGMQCSSCGHRFPLNASSQYSEHLDWHFRQNRKEKDGIRKVSSRAWFYDLHDWVEQTERKVSQEGKVQSAFFEAEGSMKADPVDESNQVQKESKKINSKNQSIPVLAEDVDGTCEICCEPLEQYWDEDAEEWRYKKAVRENKKTYHQGCFEDYIPYEYEEESRPHSPSSFLQSPTGEKITEKQVVERPVTTEGAEMKTTVETKGEELPKEVNISKEEGFVEKEAVEEISGEKEAIPTESTDENTTMEVDDTSEDTSVQNKTEARIIEDNSEQKSEVIETKKTEVIETKLNESIEDTPSEDKSIVADKVKEENMEQVSVKKEDINKDELIVTENRNKSETEANETVIKDG